MDRLINKLHEMNVGQIKLNEPMANHTTWKIGGPAQTFIIPKSLDSLMDILNIVRNENIPLFVIGRGSNLLISDFGINGIVLKIFEGLDHLEINGDEVTVGAGYPLIKLATVVCKQGLSGLEFAGGIPGSVGGAVFMNAGAHKSDISQILIRAKIVYPDGKITWYNNEEMQFSYRKSRLQIDGGICVEAVFKLTPGNKEEIMAEIKRNKEYRKRTQPWDFPCCGSVFRNPLPYHAGKLIEDAGLKGYTIGGAQVSTMHANFIVNIGGATANNVLDLIKHIQKEIYEKYEIQLQTEVEVVGNC